MCCIPFSPMMSTSSIKMNCSPFSNIICSESPCVKNMILNTYIVLVIVIVDINYFSWLTGSINLHRLETDCCGSC